MERMEFRTRMERIVRNVCNERNERNERYKRNERNERNERYKRNERNERYKRNERKTGNGNRRWGNSSLLQAAPKNQQFWVNFRRFNINTFNFWEHFPPPNFAYSARSFSLPSPNFSLPSPNFSRMRF